MPKIPECQNAPNAQIAENQKRKDERKKPSEETKELAAIFLFASRRNQTRPPPCRTKLLSCEPNHHRGSPPRCGSPVVVTKFPS